MKKVIRVCIGASLILWPLYALIVSGFVVLGKAVFYTAAAVVLVAWPLAMLLALWRAKGPRVRVYVACIWLAIGAVRWKPGGKGDDATIKSSAAVW